MHFACKIIPDLAVKKVAFLLRMWDISGTHFGPGNGYAVLNI